MEKKIPPEIPFTISAMMEAGKEMRAVADQYPDEDDPTKHYATTEAEAIERSRWQVKNPDKVPRNGQWMMEVGLARVIDRRRDDRCVISLCLSRETFCTPHQYRLSMCRITGPATFAGVPDTDGALIAACILGQGAKKVPNPSGIENSKHYVRVIEESVPDGQNQHGEDK